MNAITAMILATGMIGAAAILSPYSPVAVAQTQPAPQTGAVSQGSDALLTMPLLADKGWFVHAHGGRVRACTADGASVAGERPAPKCSQWSDY
ncbi:hypothetical protein [Yoonia vestfoldensis]|jgi:hypothetical protein|uniref:Uncharacterized protein n=1 Tax=Yoonia vestfoldensis TaxID=245188 RepID=A0A1Y0EDI6_9RHOB|nr:hypothetical protein [Yoonia vestfoldensis]ARU01675.1 hypothetical protein LOKVESSMR4R_02371 [Yoonia vestfoldensis]